MSNMKEKRFNVHHEQQQQLCQQNHHHHQQTQQQQQQQQQQTKQNHQKSHSPSINASRSSSTANNNNFTQTPNATLGTTTKSLTATAATTIPTTTTTTNTIIRTSTTKPTPSASSSSSSSPSSSSSSSPSSSPPHGSMAAASYDISWIFTRLKNPSTFWYIASQIVITAVGLFSKFVLYFMNNTRVHNLDRLINLVVKRPKGVPLVTISNHHSCFDDPGLWGVLPLRYVCNTFKIRWSLAAHDICFTNKYHSLFFMHGKCIPVVRGEGVYQDAVNLCIQKCSLGHWVHVFPEGKVNMTKEEMRLKWGVGRIIYESPRIPIILPMWHEGMDEVLPNVEPYILKWRKKVTLNVGRPLDLNDYIQDLKDRKIPEPEARKLITDKIQDVFHCLRLETEELHRERLKKDQ